MGKAADRSLTIELYDRAVARHPDVERKGKTMPYTSRNGHMFSFMSKDGVLWLRLPDGVREPYVKKFRAKACVQHGRVMEEYVEVPLRLLKKTAEFLHYFQASCDYIDTFKPKPTARKKKATKKKATKKKVVKRKVAKRKPATKTSATKKKATRKKAPTKRKAAKARRR